MKTKEELNSLKEEVETLIKKLNKLTEEELEQVTGGFSLKRFYKRCSNPNCDQHELQASGEFGLTCPKCGSPIECILF